MEQTDVTPLGSYVGFDSITSQIERKLLKRGFQFNIICVGMFPLAHLLAMSDDSPCRTNWSRKVDVDQHHFCRAPH
jgi:hypothetical protein